MNKDNETKDLTVQESGFTALAGMDYSDSELFADCNGLDMKLDKVKIPSGGVTSFEIPGEDADESETEKEITGVIVHNHVANSFYKDKYQGGNNPPDCGSFDGIIGNGCPGGECSKCPYNKFGSGEGKGKACKNRRLLYILREGELFPIMLSVPTGSLKDYSSFVKHMITKQRKLSSIVTRITLRKAVNSNGVVFSQTVFSFVRNLTPEERSAIQPVIDMAKDYSSHLSSTALTQMADDEFIDDETGKVIKPLV